jgi:putative endonuclease
MNLATVRTGAIESVIKTLDRKPQKEAAAEHIETGRDGELAAFFYLRRQGYKVVARDWKSPRAPGDIDLIAWDDDTLCFVEVKTRTSLEVATAEAAVDEHKRRTLRKLAGYYVRNLPEGTPSRFDVVTIHYTEKDSGERVPEVELFRSAFGWFESDPADLAAE